MRSTIRKTLLCMPALAFAVATSAVSLAAAPDGRGASDQTPSISEQARDRVNQANQQAPGQQAQGRTQSQQPGVDPTQTPGQQACENSHAPTGGSPGLAENENAQGGNPQANENARGSRADEHQSEQGVANSRADLAQAGDDCLDVNETIREQNEDARGQGTGNDPGDRNAGNQRRNPAG